MRWSYGVTTTKHRRDELLPQTLASLRAAGFEFPHLFVDGDADGYSWAREFGLSVTSRGPSRDGSLPFVRTHGNWILSAYELYIRDPDAVRYAVFQDDFVTYPNLREYLEKTPYPEKGYCNLYTFPSNQLHAPLDYTGWYKSNQNGRGAVALVFDRVALQTLLQAQHMVERPMDCTRGHRAVDGGIVEAMKKAGYFEFVHTPSLVQHTGDVSSMGNRPHLKANSFLGERYDAREMLKPRQPTPIPAPQISLGEKKEEAVPCSQPVPS